MAQTARWQEFCCIVACTVGMPHEKRRKIRLDQYRWNGHILLIPRMPNPFTLHEIAHWDVATPERRHLHNFGLSSSVYFATMEEQKEEIRAKEREESWTRTLRFDPWEDNIEPSLPNRFSFVYNHSPLKERTI